MAENLPDTNVGNIEYIRKKDASDWLKQYGQDVLHGKYKFSLIYIWKNLMDLPSADVAPVVRCGQCKYWHGNDSDHDYGYCYAKDGHGFGHAWGKNDFCSYGERREE